ncbi:hypothetical protein BC938DRAFT_479543 [Jimgerdemannia flammicorona]|uniref:Uncharacterized protein n=1 Tax=Jimgerdemannia flammicorona TaxID=994334 RepID=A0A433QKM1_9FUNG|nr:hypothetical protein BC938DRAFT_479543 [Jimgerdemannia flammicorona]
MWLRSGWNNTSSSYEDPDFKITHRLTGAYCSKMTFAMDPPYFQKDDGFELIVAFQTVPPPSPLFSEDTPSEILRYLISCPQIHCTSGELYACNDPSSAVGMFVTYRIQENARTSKGPSMAMALRTWRIQDRAAANANRHCKPVPWRRIPITVGQQQFHPSEDKLLARTTLTTPKDPLLFHLIPPRFRGDRVRRICRDDF